MSGTIEAWVFGYPPKQEDVAHLQAQVTAAERDLAHRSGYNAALDDLAILLATEVERLEANPGDDIPVAVGGIRWALGAIKGMR